MKLLMTALIATILAIATPTLAQTVGPHGGLLAGKDGHMAELVVTPTELAVYLVEDGKTESVKGVSLRAVVQQGSKNETLTLVAADGDKLVAKLASPLAKGAIVVITGKDGHGHPISARFVIP